MMLNCFSSALVQALKDKAAANLVKYSEDNDWVVHLAGIGSHIRETGISIDALPELIKPVQGDLGEAENVRRLHSALRQLSPLQAMDERLWVFLSHLPYWDYMQARWAPRTAGALRDRYFFDGAGFGTLVRNGISRLWWFGHLTWDPKLSDPYELTEILLCNQDVQQALLQRSFGKSRHVLLAVLEHIKLHRGTLYADGLGVKIKSKAKLLNVLGGVSLLDAMRKKAIHDFLDQES